jgi:hypothetical protein
MKKSTIVSLLALSVVVYSCKKDKDKSTQDRLIGKWSMVSAKWNDHYNGTNHYDSSSYGSGLFNVEFKSDGKVITSSSMSADKDTSTYKMLDDKRIVFDNVDTLTINSISDNDFQLYYKEVYQNNEYYEEWQNFKK